MLNSYVLKGNYKMLSLHTHTDGETVKQAKVPQIPSEWSKLLGVVTLKTH